ERSSDRGPFRSKLAGCRRAARLPIPVAGVVAVTLHAMQVGVNPGAIRALLAHDDVVRLVPGIVAGPPQRGERRRQPARRFLARQAAYEFRARHDPAPDRLTD